MPEKEIEQNTKQEKENRRFCKRCLTRDMADGEELFRSMWEYINNLDIDIKTPAAVYEDRLAVCRKCDLLFEGMCRSCGCYVEMRAAVAGNGCPWSKWHSMEQRILQE